MLDLRSLLFHLLQMENAKGPLALASGPHVLSGTSPHLGSFSFVRNYDASPRDNSIRRPQGLPPPWRRQPFQSRSDI